MVTKCFLELETALYAHLQSRSNGTVNGGGNWDLLG
jgi:hypothetical protein